ncbi:MFS transporter [Roseicella aquatilis]|uniref:MFS transporter n=1 Tax=Roseicella aquatilis TaxID=2527868 RepID=A0A4R4DBD3_9PROT|nr:MFS transporter [Roseicella aquatilis]TCZ57787.1 MFS transporter [Roseicella aquatilis]
MPNRRPASIWLVMLALLGTHLAGMGAFLTLPVLAPPIAAELGIPASLAGFNTSLAYAGALLSGPFAQTLLRRHGGIRVCQGALVVIAAGIALAVLGHPLALVASAVLAGIGHGPLTPAGSHVLAARTPDRIRSLVFSLKQTGVPAGAMLVAAVAPLVGSLYGWRAGVLAIAGFALLLALALQPLRAGLDADRDPRASGASPWREALASLALLRTDPGLRALTVTACCLGIGQFAYLTFFVVWQVEALGVPLLEAGGRLALGQVAGIAGRILWAVLADRIGARPALLAIALGAALAATGLALAQPGWPGMAVTGIALLMGATAVGWTGLLLAEIARVAPPGRVGAATSAMGFAMGLTMLVAPSAMSLLVQATGGYGAAFGLCVAAAAVAVLVLRGVPGRAASPAPGIAVSPRQSRSVP